MMEITNVPYDTKLLNASHIDVALDQYLENECPQNIVEDVMECHTMEITNGTHNINPLDVTHIDLDLGQHLQNER